MGGTAMAADNVDAIRDQATATVLSSGTVWAPDDVYIGWPTIAKTKDGELIVAFSGDREKHVCPWGKTQLVRSRDNGKTWSDAETVNNTPLDDRDAGIIQTRQGTLVVSWFTSLAFEKNAGYRRHREKLSDETVDRWFGYWIRRSEDNGKTWGDYIRVETTAPHGPIELSDGRLLYVGCTTTKTVEERVGVIESRDDGRTWTRIGSIAQAEGDDPNECHEPHVVECADGSLVAMARYHGKGTENAYYLRQASSTDGGKTWTPFAVIPIWGYPPHLICLDNGWLVVSYGRRKEPFGERACISKDEGKTWDVENEIVLS
ncbi:MAG: exo-alpha-sialidase, partial [bacterium]|nr:exo-alpha-sialidase [bacterium]